jgi:hypothetical protein
LASDFLNTNPDGTLIDRSAFIVVDRTVEKRVGKGSSFSFPTVRRTAENQDCSVAEQWIVREVG